MPRYGSVEVLRRSFFNRVDKTREVDGSENVNGMQIFPYNNSKGIP